MRGGGTYPVIPTYIYFFSIKNKGNGQRSTRPKR